MRQNWFCASLIALVAFALPSPATAQDDMLNCTTDQADCEIMLAEIEWTITEDSLLDRLRTMTDRRLSELATLLDPATATALEQDEAIFRHTLHRDLAVAPETLRLDTSSRYMIAGQLAWRLDKLLQVDPDPEGFAGDWFKANGRVSLETTDDGVTVTADGYESERLSWLCEMSVPGEFDGPSIRAKDNYDTVELHREGAALRVVHTFPPGKGAWSCGFGGSLNGLYFRLK